MTEGYGFNCNAREVKTWLNKQGINAKYARSISGKRNGQRVVHYIEARSGSLQEIFPVEMRERMLKIIYGDDFESKNGRWVAGNVSPHMVNMRPIEWLRLMETDCNRCNTPHEVYLWDYELDKEGMEDFTCLCGSCYTDISKEMKE